MCIIIIAGKKHDIFVEIGINNASEMIENEDNEDFFEKNSGPRKLYPGGQLAPFKELRLFLIQ